MTPEVNHKEIQQSSVDDNQRERKEYTVLVGELIEQEYVPNIQPSSCFEENVICLDVFFLYNIKVQQVISGEPLQGIIKVARYQHSKYMYKSSENAIFVIERIKNKKTSQLLKTNFYITEYITPEVTYCMSENFNKYLSEAKEIFDSNCLLQKDVYGGLKEDLIELVDSRVKKELRKQKILIKHDYEFSDGNNLLLEIDDYDDDGCADYADLDKLMADKNCNQDDGIEVYNVYVYEVQNTKATYVKQLILDELSQTNVSLVDVKMNFHIIEKKSKSILYWHYKVEYLK